LKKYQVELRRFIKRENWAHMIEFQSMKAIKFHYSKISGRLA